MDDLVVLALSSSVYGEQQPLRRKEAAALPLPAQAGDEAEGSKVSCSATATLLFIHLLRRKSWGGEADGQHCRCRCAQQWGRASRTRHLERGDGAELDVSEEVGTCSL